MAEPTIELRREPSGTYSVTHCNEVVGTGLTCAQAVDHLRSILPEGAVARPPKLLDIRHCDTLKVLAVKHLESAFSYLMSGDAKNASLVLDSALHVVQELIDRVAPYAKG